MGSILLWCGFNCVQFLGARLFCDLGSRFVVRYWYCFVWGFYELDVWLCLVSVSMFFGFCLWLV